MPLQHDAPRFTLDQRDEILNLAARLQIQHESTVGVDELFAEAIAAGIDPRFVQEATIWLERKPRPQRLRAPFVAFALFTLQACALMAHQFVWFRRGDTGLNWPEYVVASGLAFLIALPATRPSLARRFVPLVSLAVWLAVATLSFVLSHLLFGLGWYSFVIPTALFYGLVQSLAAILAILVRRAAEWRPEGGRSFRFYRGDRA